MPTTFSAILVIVIFIIPGFIFIKIKEILSVTEPRSEFDKIIGCIIVSSLVNTIWLPELLIWDKSYANIKPDLIINYFINNLLDFCLIIWITPILLAILDGYLRKYNLYYRVLRTIKLTYKSKGPEPWYNVFSRDYKPWVRIYVNDDTIFQGIADEISTYPFEKQIYLKKVKILDKEGKVKRVLKRAEGVYINAKDIKVIEIYQ